MVEVEGPVTQEYPVADGGGGYVWRFECGGGTAGWYTSLSLVHTKESLRMCDMLFDATESIARGMTNLSGASLSVEDWSVWWGRRVPVMPDGVRGSDGSMV
jgi:hypothetical protein